jgi:hypothetical protein|nr:MAG TPA_asm: Protein of unknown function (DUF1056) [Caudoviricetes sp.]
MSNRNITQRTKNRFLFLCSYIEDILVLFGLLSIIIAAYLMDLKLGLLVQGFVLIWIGFVLSKILK